MGTHAVLRGWRRGLPAALLCLAAHAALAPDVAAQTVTPNADGSYTIPNDWALKPSGLDAGDRFRLLFITRRQGGAGVSVIRQYNLIVEREVELGGHSAVRPYAERFRIVGSTSVVDARDNTSATGTGVPVYWLNGAQVADGYSDFWDGTWDSNAARHSDGRASTYRGDVWTGSNADGTKYETRELDSIPTRVGSLASTSNTISSSSADGSINLTRPYYGLSPVFVVDALPVVTITGGAAITEGVAATFTVTADKAVDADLTVNLSVADAASPRDFVAAADEGDQTVTIAAGDRTATFTLDTVNDSKDVDEPDGAVSVTLQNGTGYTVGTTSPATVTVTDNDATTATLEGNAVTLPEPDTLDFTVRLNRALVNGEALVVPVTFGGTVGDGDWEVSCPSPLPTGVTCGSLVSSALPVTFTGTSTDPSAQLVTLTLQAIADATAESAAESMVIGLGTLTPTGLSGGATGVDNLADFNIVDPFVVQLVFEAPRSNVTEGPGATAAFNANVTSGTVPAGGVVIPFTVNAGDAVDGDASSDDYGPVPAGISIAAGAFSGTASVPIVDDDDDEPRERLRFMVGELPPGYVISTNVDSVNKNVVILDDESTSVNLKGGGTITEEDATSSATMTISLARALGVDPLGTGSEVVNVPVALTTSTGAALPGSASPLFTVTASGTGVSVGNANTATPTITFTGHGTDVVQTATVTFTPTANGDSDMTSETVTATMGTLTSSNVDGGVSKGSATSATLTIADDDAPPELSVAVVGSASLTEGGSATIRVTRVGGDVSSALSFSATTTDATDFSGAFSNVTSFPANQSSVDITYSVADNSADTAPGEATYALDANAAAYTISSTAGSVSLTVADNDATTVTLAGAAGNVEEGANKTLTVTLGRGLVSGEALAVPLTFGGTATRNTDYTLSGASDTGLSYQNLESGNAGVTFTGPSSGTTATVATLTLAAAADAVDEPTPETVNIGLGTLNASSGTGLGGGASGTDDLASFSIEDPPANTVSLSVSDNGAGTEGGGALTITATLDQANASAAAISIPIEVRPDGTTAQPSDYTVASSISIADNARSGTTSFTVTDDQLAEGHETVVVVLGSPLPGDILAGTTTVSIGITDDDEAGLVFSPTSLGVTEGDDGTYTVKLASQPTGTVTVTIGSNNADVTVDPASLTFNANGSNLWSTPQTVTVTAGDDTDTANDTATLTHTASGGDYDDEGEDFAVTVTDNDTPGLVFSPPSLNVDEGDSAGYTVKLATEPTNTVTVTITGHAVTDLTLDETSLEFTTTTWNDAQTVTVSAGQDLDAANDTATLTHAAAGGGYSLSANLAVTVTDDEEVGLVFSQPSLGVTEGTNASYTVKLASEPTASTVTVTIGSNNADVTVDPASLTFNANGSNLWSTPQTVTVTAGDDTDTANDTAALTHEASGGDYGDVEEDFAVTVTDNDTPGLVFSPTSLTVAEGANGSYTVKLATEPTNTVTVTIGSNNADVTVDPASLAFDASGSNLWSTPQTVTVTAGDDTDTANDTATLTHAASGGGYSLSANLAVTVTDNDDDGKPKPTVSFSSANYTLIERDGGGNVGGFTVTLSEIRDEDTVVGLTFTNETADDDDYASEYLPTSVTIAAGFISLSYPILALLDSKEEPDETFTIEINSVSSGVRTGRPSLTRMTIKDNDGTTPPTTPVASFASAASSAAESAGTRNLTVNLSPAPQTAITVSYGIGGSAVGGSDYTTLSGTVAVSGGVTSVDIPVAITDDTADENDETVILTLTQGSGYTVGSPNSHTLTITDNDGGQPPPTTPVASFASAASSAAESAGTRNLTVNLSPAPQADITVSYGIGGSAVGGSDYTTLSGTVAVSGGATSVDIPVAITDDTADENDETVILTLTQGSGYTVGSPNSHTLTIQDNDGGQPPPTTPVASFASAASSAAESAGTRNLTVNLSPAPQADITVSYGIGGSAVGGSDYTALSGTVPVSGGATSVDIPVAITDDTADENDETVILTLTQGSGYTVGSPNSHTLTIQDNDGGQPPPTTPVASFASAASSAAESAGTRNLTVNLSPAPQAAITVSYGIGGSAVGGSDYTTLSGTVAVSGGATSVDIPVAITDDTADENDETVILTLTQGSGYTVGSPNSHTLTITDNDDVVPPPPTTPVASFASAASSAAESAGTRNLTVNLSPAPQTAITVSYGIGGSAVGGSDYTALSGTVAVSGGATSVDIPVAITDDTADENDETVILTLTQGSGYTVGSPNSHTLTIQDNDGGQPPPTTPVASFASAASSAAESAGTRNLTVNLSPAPQAAITVSYGIGGSAVGGSDYTTLSGTVAVSGGATSVDIPVAITDDTADENDETVILTLTQGSGYTVGSPNSHTLTITDNDDVVPPPPTTPVASFASAASSAAESAGTRNLTVNLSPAPQTAITVSYGIGGSAVGGSDYTALSGTVAVSGGATSVDIPVAITDDTADENDETVILTLTQGSGYTVGSPNSHTLTIQDNDGGQPPPTTPVASFASAASSAAESAGTRNLTVNLSPAPQTAITVSYGIGGSAVGGSDYTALSGTVAVPGGATSVDIPVAITDDTANENDETVILTLTQGSGYTVGSPNSHTLTIQDNDGGQPPPPPPTPSVSLSASPNPVTEGSSVTVTARLSTALSSSVTIPLTLTSGTAEPDDYGSLKSITISGGQTSGTGTVTTAQDADEADETFTVALGILPSDVTAGNPSSVRVTIRDDDGTRPPPPPPPANRAPSVSAWCDPCEVPPGGAVQLTATGSDPDGDALTYGWSAGAGSFSGATDAATTRWTAPETTGAVTIRVHVSDGRGGSASAEVTVTVEVPNRAPSVSAWCDPCEVHRGGEVGLTAAGSDPDGDALTYAWSAGAGSFSGATDAATTRWTAPETTGAVMIRVYVSDGYGGSASAEVTVEVVNRAPSVSATCDPCGVHRGGEVGLTAAGSDPDGDALTYAWSAGAGSFSEGTDAATARWRAPETVGEVTIRVDVSDGHGGSASAEVTVEVVNRAPSVSATCDPCGVHRGGEVGLTAAGSDPDGDALTYAWSAGAGGFSEGTDAATARWTAPEAVGAVTIRVEVSDGHGGSASAEVTVEVANRPPAFESSEYALELRENVDGRQRSVDLGAVTASDPDGDALTYELAAGDGSRFTAGTRDGVVRYTGPGEDFESEPNRYELAVRTRDPYGAEAEARVVVTVVNVNEAPEAVDDEATTDEDRAITVDVLANDTDADGDGLRVESVSTAAHGITSIASSGGVIYTPTANYHGPDRFIYVITDPAGETASAAVEVTVLSVNDAPAAVGVIPDQPLAEGGGPRDVDVAPFFDDADGDALTYRAVSSNPDVVTVGVAGALLTLTPVVYGTAAVTVTAEDAGGLSATQTFAVGVDDRLARAVMSDTLAAMARSHLASARMTLGRRVESGAGEASRLTVMGRAVPLGKASARRAAEQLIAGWLSGIAWSGASAQGAGGLFGPAGMSPGLGAYPAGGLGGPGGYSPGPGGGLGGPAGGLGGPAGGLGGSPGGFGGPALGGSAALGIPVSSGGLLYGLGGFGGGSETLLRGTEFELALGGNEDGRARAGRRWSVWGQGDIQTFQGAPTLLGYDARYDGDVRTGYVGVDAQLTRRWLAGVAVSRSGGRGDWEVGSARGRLRTTLTALHPYAQWSNGTTSVWTTAGGGWGGGEAENVREATGRVGTSDLGLRLGLVELRRRVGAVGGGAELGLRADAAWAELRTGDGRESVDRLTAAVNQQRVGADVSRPVRLGALALAPFGEAHLRRDEGGGQNGIGMEVAFGLGLTSGIVRLDVQGRTLAVHSAAGYGERGAGLTLTVGGRQREGLSLSVSPSWGDAASGTGTLWQEEVYRHYLSEKEQDTFAVDARGDYGMRLPNGSLLNWFGSYSHSPYGRSFFVGGGIGGLADALLPGR